MNRDPARLYWGRRRGPIQARRNFLLLAARLVWAGVAVALVAALVILAPSSRAPARAIPAANVEPVDVGPDIASFYQDHDFRPLWVAGRTLRPEAARLAARLGDPAELSGALAAAQSGDPRQLTRADLLLSRAYVDFVRGAQQPPEANRMRYIDPEVAPRRQSAREILEGAASSPSLAVHFDAMERINPVVAGLTRGLARYRARWSTLPQERLPAPPGEAQLRRRLGSNSLTDFQAVHGLPVTGRPDPATIAALNRGATYYERLAEANIERARAIPARTGRYVLVDTASARLWMIEDGRVRDSMRVVVGKRAMPTPLMAGLIRYATLNPYWNLPPDLIRERARKGLRAIERERLQVLSSWDSDARVLDPRRVDWRAVAAGRRLVNLRQTPGAHNMMGRIKFMMPNDLGVYLHDTPLRDLLARDDRHFSSGCVRLEDAQRLGRWLFGGAVPAGDGRAEQRVDLPEAVPVYIAYFTALPSGAGIRFQADVYRRDRAPSPRSTV